MSAAPLGHVRAAAPRRPPPASPAERRPLRAQRPLPGPAATRPRRGGKGGQHDAPCRPTAGAHAAPPAEPERGGGRLLQAGPPTTPGDRHISPAPNSKHGTPHTAPASPECHSKSLRLSLRLALNTCFLPWTTRIPTGISLELHILMYFLHSGLFKTPPAQWRVLYISFL